jgi:hypothetical protein
MTTIPNPNESVQRALEDLHDSFLKSQAWIEKKYGGPNRAAELHIQLIETYSLAVERVLKGMVPVPFVAEPTPPFEHRDMDSTTERILEPIYTGFRPAPEEGR